MKGNGSISQRFHINLPFVLFAFAKNFRSRSSGCIASSGADLFLVSVLDSTRGPFSWFCSPAVVEEFRGLLTARQLGRSRVHLLQLGLLAASVFVVVIFNMFYIEGFVGVICSSGPPYFGTWYIGTLLS